MSERPDLEPYICEDCGLAVFREEGYSLEPRAPCERCGGRVLVAASAEWDAAPDKLGVTWSPPDGSEQ